jgi:squalene-hopene/tetraprenyl-beta-curcumene cyclase
LHATARAVLRLSELDRLLPGSERSVADAKPLPAFDPADAGRVQLGLDRARAFLLEQQTEPGRWGAMGRSDLGITAMVAGSLALAQERSPELQAALQQTVQHLLAAQDADGAIHEGQLQSYVTSASVMALTRMDPAAHDAVVQAARAYLQRLQADEGEGYTPEHRYYGGVGYGGDERPDLSNLQMALEALSAAGVEEGDESYRKALEFLQRTQNRSESNDLDLEVEGQRIRPGNDGGAAYAPRSYGSMTYALLRGFLFAGLSKDDPRVVAAWEWIKANYTLDVNPGFPAGSDPAAPYQGLFYYYYTMAKALALFGEEQWTGANGEVVRWREQLAGRLLAMQRADGSWVNENSPRWWEGNPTLATAYAVLALEATLNDGPRE